MYKSILLFRELLLFHKDSLALRLLALPQFNYRFLPYFPVVQFNYKVLLHYLVFYRVPLDPSMGVTMYQPILIFRCSNRLVILTLLFLISEKYLRWDP